MFFLRHFNKWKKKGANSVFAEMQLDVDGNGQMDPKSLRAALKAKVRVLFCLFARNDLSLNCDELM